MKKVVECVPNFSEGRRPEVVDAIVAEIKSVNGITLLDKEMDPAHNRAVVTFVGDPEACVEAAFRGISKAKELIDLTKHQGEHPRMGATDVCPFIPISNVSTEECVDMAKRVAKRVADELKIPTYLYEQAAQRPERVDLANIRKGEFEGLREAVKTDPNRAPDFGPRELHPTAGATVIGARFPLVAYNVNLATTDVDVAKKIAKNVRFRDGGLRYAKAMGFMIPEKNCAQVSMNLTNYTGTSIFRAYEMVKREAERYGVMTKESEIIGLVPLQALVDTAVWYLQLDSFKNDQILENRLTPGQSVGDFLDQLAAPTPTPGGGSVSALAGANGAALLSMVAGLTIGKKGYEEVSEKMTAVKTALAPMRGQFSDFVDKDAQAFDKVMAAFKLPKDTEEQKAARSTAIQDATKGASEVPLQVMALAVEALKHGEFIAANGNKNSISDVGVAGLSLQTALQGAHMNVLINLTSLKDADYVTRKKNEAANLLAQGKKLMTTIEQLVEKIIS
jgi:glutamate formiminotransferase/formiminotetrahydrofolate cyclodeaminase